MLDIYKKALLPSVKCWFIEQNEDWILQEDNDPKHQSKVCTEWKETSGIKQLKWSSCWPDANPIENVWAYMKQRLRGRQVFAVKQLPTAIYSPDLEILTTQIRCQPGAKYTLEMPVSLLI